MEYKLFNLEVLACSIDPRNRNSFLDDNFGIRVSNYNILINFTCTFSERIIAVHKPGLYQRLFSFRMKVFFIFCVLLCVSGSLTWAALSANTEMAYINSTSTQHCAIISSTSKAFSTFHFIFVPFAYFGSFLSLCTISYIHRVCLSPEFENNINLISEHNKRNDDCW